MRLRELKEFSYWHGTDVPDIKELTPRSSDLVGRDCVFAAILPEVAVAMAGHWTDEDFDFGRSVSDRQDPDKVPYVLQELWDGAIDEFLSGKTVYLYEINTKGFHSNKKLQDFEVVSYQAAPIEGEQKIDDPLKYLQESKMVKVKRFGE